MLESFRLSCLLVFVGLGTVEVRFFEHFDRSVLSF